MMCVGAVVLALATLTIGILEGNKELHFLIAACSYLLFLIESHEMTINEPPRRERLFLVSLTLHPVITL